MDLAEWLPDNGAESAATADPSRAARVDLPGTGERGANCGVISPNGFCVGEGHHTQWGRHNCQKQSCPEHGEDWVDKRTAEVVKRLAARRWANEDSMEGRRIVQGYVSPEPGTVPSAAELFGRRGEVHEILDEHGVRGRVVVPHAFRVKEKVKDRYNALRRKGVIGGDVALWEWIKENDQVWRSQVYWSPHYHFIGLCADFETEPGEGADGCPMHDPWICQNSATGRGVSPNPGEDGTFEAFRNLHDAEPYRDMIDAVRYMLHHCAVAEGRQSVTYGGSLAGASFDPEEAISGGALAAIDRRVDELLGLDSEEALGQRECQHEDCEARVESPEAIPGYIRQHGDRLAMDTQRRLWSLWGWWRGDKPPPGLKNPTSLRDAERALKVMAELKPVKDRGGRQASLA